MVKIIYKPGDKVFAKVKGYPPWPAKVVGDTGKKKYNVLFYGTQETGAIKPEDIAYYLKYKDSYVHKYMKRVGYEDAVKQIEEAIKKDGGDGNDGAHDESKEDIDMSDTSSVSSASDKKIAKRKVTSLPAEETSPKKTTGRGRRRSVATSETKEDTSEEPAPKKPRRKSNSSTGSKEEEDTSEKSKKTSDNGIKEETPVETAEEKQTIEPEAEEKLPKKAEQESSTSEEKPKKVETVQDIPKEEVVKEDKTADKEASLTKEKPVEATGKPKEPEFVEIKPSADGVVQMEEEPSEETDTATEKSIMKAEIVTEQALNNNILYAEHVKKHLDLYKDKPVEVRETRKDEILVVKLPAGMLVGVKLHKEWPLTHTNERDRALYDEKVAKTALEVKELLSSGKRGPHQVDAEIVADIEVTLDDLKEIAFSRDIENKRKRLLRLRKEADLVTWDSKIKNNLGLDKAMPDAALECLKEFSKLEKDLDALMLKKHPHVLDTIRRLRKYVGNVKEWDMNDRDVEGFTKKAEKIRNEAERIYNTIKDAVNVQEEKEKSTFWDSFMDLVADFRTKCKDLSESEVLILCAEPDSRQAFLDKLDEVSESEGTKINPSNKSEPVLKEASVQGWSEKK